MKHSHYPLRHENHNAKALLPTSRIVTQDGQVLVNEVLDADYGHHLVQCANAVESIGGDTETVGELVAALEQIEKDLTTSEDEEHALETTRTALRLVRQGMNRRTREGTYA